ncbi:MAG: hypothetical protein ACE5OP_11670 [Candidatus Glassbacteria bacterium]
MALFRWSFPIWMILTLACFPKNASGWRKPVDFTDFHPVHEEDIDRVRTEVPRVPTDGENALERIEVAEKWMRLIMLESGLFVKKNWTSLEQGITKSKNLLAKGDFRALDRLIKTIYKELEGRCNGRKRLQPIPESALTRTWVNVTGDLVPYNNMNQGSTRPVSVGQVDASVYEQNGYYLFSIECDNFSVKYEFDPTLPSLSGLKAVVDGRYEVLPAYAAGPRWKIGKKTYHPGSKNLHHKLLQKRLEDGKLSVTHQVMLDGKPFRYAYTLYIEGKSLVVEFSSETGGAAMVFFGSMQFDDQKAIIMPYNQTVQVRYLYGPYAYFSNAFDYTISNASYMDFDEAGNCMATYVACIGGKRNPVRERIFLTISPEFAEVLPSIPLDPSPYLEEMARSIIFDEWWSKFQKTIEDIKLIHSYGVRNCILIRHAWQQKGIDHGYPLVLSARTSAGGDRGLIELSETCRSLGYRIALHLNPDQIFLTPVTMKRISEGYLKMEQDGSQRWREGSMGYLKADKMVSLNVEEIMPEIMNRYHTTAVYYDVVGKLTPWWYTYDDYDPALGTGFKFRTMHEATIELFQKSKELVDGPVFTEGRGMMYAGVSDGNESEYFYGEMDPLIVDYELLRVHPNMASHGMGYFGRWKALYRPRGGKGESNYTWYRSDIMTQSRLDTYRLQELAFGHIAFLQSKDVAPPLTDQFFHEYNMVVPIQKHYANSKVRKILYDVDGRLVPASIALVTSSMRKVYVEYDSGLSLWLNGSGKDWVIGNHTIPQGGFVARAPGLEAWVRRLDGIYGAYVETEESIYCDARSNAPNPRPAKLPVSMSIESAKIEQGRLTLRIGCLCEETIAEPLTLEITVTNQRQPVKKAAKAKNKVLGNPFIVTMKEFTMPEVLKKGETVLGPYTLDIPPQKEAWKPGNVVEIRLAPVKNRSRLPIMGRIDWLKRSIAGYLRLYGEADRVQRVEISKFFPYDFEIVDFTKHANPDRKILDFGAVRTNGTILATKTADGLLVTPFPRGKRFVVLFDKRFLQEAKDYCIEALDSKGDVIETVETREIEGYVGFRTTSGKAAYYRISGCNSR